MIGQRKQVGHLRASAEQLGTGWYLHAVTQTRRVHVISDIEQEEGNRESNGGGKLLKFKHMHTSKNKCRRQQGVAYVMWFDTTLVNAGASGAGIS